MNTLYPIFIKLNHKLCIVVGGGEVAYRKVTALLQAEADVVVISPEISPKFENLLQTKQIKYLARGFQSGDLKGAFVVIAATNNTAVNQRIWDEANRLNLLVNVVDVPEFCNFYVPAIIREGDVAVAISTNGKAPYLSKKLRLKLQSLLSSWNLGTLVEQIADKRQQLKQEFPEAIKTREKNIKSFIDQLFND